MNGDGRGYLAHEVQGDLLKQIECVEIDGVQASLRVRSASQEEGIDVCQLTASSGEHQDGAQDRPSYNPEIVGSDEVKIRSLG